MKFKLAIANVITFAASLQILDGDTSREFKFQLHGKRLSAEELRDTLTAGSDRGDQPVAQVLGELITGWTGQTIVLGEDGKPAEFSAEAFSALLSGVPGADVALWQQYLNAVAASVGKAGQRKN
jgi:hypothetical protein